MAKRKKRNAITLVSLLLALAALIGVYVWYSNKPAKDNSDTATSTIDLATVDTTKLSSLHYIKDDADITLVQKDDSWISQDEPDRPINQDYVKAILTAINDIKADRVIMEKPDNLADYGLAEPVASLQATMTDGTTVTVKIGNATSDSKGYYGMVNDDGKVYLLPVEMGSALQYNNTQMTAVITGPEITAANISHITITNRDGQDFDLNYIDDKSLDNTGNNLYSWNIIKPYGKGYTADSTKVSDLQSNYTTFTYTSCVDYKGEDLSKYGLDDPAASIYVGYYTTTTEALPTPETDPTTGESITEKTTYDNHDYKVFVGNKDADGNYYVRIDGSNAVYTISADSIDKMLQVDAFSILNPYVLIPNIDTVDKIVFDIAGTTYTMDIKRTAQKNSDGTDETVATYYYNGNEVKEDSFKSLYQQMISAQYDTEIKDTVSTDGVAPYMSMSFHIFGDNERTISASFLPYNDSFYIVQKDGETRFFVDKKKIDAIAAAVSQFTDSTTTQ